MKKMIEPVVYVLVFCFAMVNVPFAQTTQIVPREFDARNYDLLIKSFPEHRYSTVSFLNKNGETNDAAGTETNETSSTGTDDTSGIETNGTPDTGADDTSDTGTGGGGGSSGTTIAIVAVAVVAVVAVAWYLVWRHNKAKQKTIIQMEANLPMVEYHFNDSISLTLDPQLRQRFFNDPMSLRDLEAEDIFASEIALQVKF